MRFPLLAISACTILAACGSGEKATSANAAAAAAFVPPATQPPSPVAGQTQTTPLTDYIGHYPDDPVDGVGFFDRTQVATALDGAVIDAKLRRAIIHNEGPRTPIFRVGTRVATWGCEPQDCGDHNWTLLIDPVSGKGEVCYHDGAGASSKWYAGSAPTIRPGDCPSERKG